MKQSLNHSRKISYGTKEAADREYWKLKQTPTAKQKKYFLRLVLMCRDNELDMGTGYKMRTRVDYAMAIDALKERLIEAGVLKEEPKKDVCYVVTHGSDRMGNYFTHETIEVEERT